MMGVVMAKNNAAQKEILIFTLKNQEFALPVEPIEIVVRMVEITLVPDSSTSIYGIINFRGKVIPVVDTWVKLGFESRKINIYDHLIIVKTMNGYVALIVDNVKEVITCSTNDITATDDIDVGKTNFSGVIILSSGIVLLNNPENLIHESDLQLMDRLTVEERALCQS